jgi:hypothetical protein
VGSDTEGDMVARSNRSQHERATGGIARADLRRKRTYETDLEEVPKQRDVAAVPSLKHGDRAWSEMPAIRKSDDYQYRTRLVNGTRATVENHAPFG